MFLLPASKVKGVILRKQFFSKLLLSITPYSVPMNDVYRGHDYRPYGRRKPQVTKRKRKLISGQSFLHFVQSDGKWRWLCATGMIYGNIKEPSLRK